MLRYVSHLVLNDPGSQRPFVVKRSRSMVKTKSAEHVSSMASRHGKRELNHCMLSATYITCIPLFTRPAGLPYLGRTRTALKTIPHR